MSAKRTRPLQTRWPVPKGRARYLLEVEYDGFACDGGAQRQRQSGVSETRTVQGELEKALSQLLQRQQSVVCGSRTDAGGHSLRNCFHLDAARASPRKPHKLIKPHPPEQLLCGTNHFLRGSGVQIRSAHHVDSRCHARFSPTQRVYAYRLVCGADAARPSLFQQRQAWFVPSQLDVDSMNTTAKTLEGYHDFSTFRASGCQGNSPWRTLDELSVSQHEPPLGCGSSCQLLLIRARAKSFLYRQVRFLVGALKEAGKGKLGPERARALLASTDGHRLRPQMAPCQGLFLEDVMFPPELLSNPRSDGWEEDVNEMDLSECEESDVAENKVNDQMDEMEADERVMKAVEKTPPT